MRMNGIRSVFSFSAAVCSANCRTTCLNDVQKQDNNNNNNNNNFI